MKPSNNPVLDAYLKAKAKEDAEAAAEITEPEVVTGTMSTESIFDLAEERGEPQRLLEKEANASKKAKAKAKAKKTVFRTGPFERNVEHMRMILDPDPRNRRRWEQKMVIRQVKKRGRLTKDQVLKRTERNTPK